MSRVNDHETADEVKVQGTYNGVPASQAEENSQTNGPEIRQKTIESSITIYNRPDHQRKQQKKVLNNIVLHYFFSWL